MTQAKQDKIIFVDVVAYKCVEDRIAVERVYAHFELLGYPEVLYRPDQDNAINVSLALVATRLRQDGIVMVPQQIPKGDSASNVAETGVHQIKCKTRRLLSAARSLHRITIRRERVCLLWEIKYAGPADQTKEQMDAHGGVDALAGRSCRRDTQAGERRCFISQQERPRLS